MCHLLLRGFQFFTFHILLELSANLTVRRHISVFFTFFGDIHWSYEERERRKERKEEDEGEARGEGEGRWRVGRDDSGKDRGKDRGGYRTERREDRGEREVGLVPP